MSLCLVKMKLVEKMDKVKKKYTNSREREREGGKKIESFKKCGNDI